MITPRMETERLLLREIHEDDVDAIFSCWMQDEDVSRYMWWKASDDINDAKEFVDFELGNLENDQWNRWIIESKENKEILGTCLIFLMKIPIIGIFLIIWEKDFGEWDM